MSSNPPSSGSNPPIQELINDYYKHKLDLTQYIEKPAPTPSDEEESSEEAPKSPEDVLQQRVEELKLRPKKSAAEVQREFYFPEGKRRNKANMPVHPAEENVSGNLTDQVAKESKDSTASTHPHHDQDTGATSGGSIGALAHKSKGPVIAQDIGEPASKEELKKRAEELNK